MRPISPVIPGIDVAKEVQFGGPACGQPEYIPVPALVNRDDGRVVCRYTFSAEERKWIGEHGADLYLTFLGGMPPHIVQAITVDESLPHYSPKATAFTLGIPVDSGLTE